MIIPHKIIRSRRRTIALEIQADATLIVRAPVFASPRTINKFIAAKKDWIQKKQAIMRTKRAESLPKQFIDGEKFYYLGDTYKLLISDKYSPETIREHTFVLSPKQLDRAPEIMTKWYKKQARNYIEKRVWYYAKLKNLSPEKIRITSAEKRWGSCSSSGNLNFSWRLIMAPPKVIDYVVVHELAHLKYQDHSQNFWNEVRKTVPNYQKYRQWLRDRGHLFII